ncbi:MAG: class I SAM-dependent DNA methyltransferase [Alistipes finegoldii]
MCDPTCGSGSLLIKAGRGLTTSRSTVRSSTAALWALAMMNMLLHGFDSATIRWGDTLRNLKLKEGDALMKFDTVVANPPSLESGRRRGADDPTTAWRGIRPKSKGDWPHLPHARGGQRARQGGRRRSHGVLFRGASEENPPADRRGEPRRSIIGLRPTFYGTACRHRHLQQG